MAHEEPDVGVAGFVAGAGEDYGTEGGGGGGTVFVCQVFLVGNIVVGAVGS